MQDFQEYGSASTTIEDGLPGGSEFDPHLTALTRKLELIGM